MRGRGTVVAALQRCSMRRCSVAGSGNAADNAGGGSCSSVSTCCTAHIVPGLGGRSRRTTRLADTRSYGLACRDQTTYSPAPSPSMRSVSITVRSPAASPFWNSCSIWRGSSGVGSTFRFFGAYPLRASGGGSLSHACRANGGAHAFRMRSHYNCWLMISSSSSLMALISASRWAFKSPFLSLAYHRMSLFFCQRPTGAC